MNTSTPETAFSDLHKAIADKVGIREMTISMLDHEKQLARRAYTSNAEVYPVSGLKPMTVDLWSETVLDQGKTFVTNSTEELIPHFFDHAVINSLGCEAVTNIPVKAADGVVGTVNLMDRAGYFTPERVSALNQIVEDHTGMLVLSLQAPAN
jgi:hypothetical protein